MPTEFEVKFLDINVEKIKEILLNNGATRVHKRKLYKRHAYARCGEAMPGFARVRKEGKDVTMTAKFKKDEKYYEEYEVNIKDGFETGVAFMNALGLEPRAYQESLREKWSHPLVHEITFDTLPGLPTYMEVDCTSEENLNQIIKLLNLDESKKRFGGFDSTYFEYYDIPRDTINRKTPSLTFVNIQNEIKPTKNIELFQKVCKAHNAIADKIKKKKLTRESNKK